MKKILLIGKLNDMLKDLNAYLSGYFHVQLCSENPNVLMGMIKVVNPDLILISLIGSYDMDTSIFRQISWNYNTIPVLTIGTERERSDFLKFYEDEQFENLIRPIENAQVLEAICNKLHISVDMQSEQDNQGSEASEAKKKVLVVDDDPAILRSVKGMLDANYQVSIATSGMKAMTSIGRNRPDLILLDYEMPVCDGRQTLEMIRADDELAEIPVIFLTGISDREHVEAVLQLRPTGYILKPAVKEKLIEAIEKGIQNKGA